jgi:hypothetical protein
MLPLEPVGSGYLFMDYYLDMPGVPVFLFDLKRPGQRHTGRNGHLEDRLEMGIDYEWMKRYDNL